MREVPVKEIVHFPRGKEQYDIDIYLSRRLEQWEKKLRKMSLKTGLKFDCKLVVTLQKPGPEDHNVHIAPCFRSTARLVPAPNFIRPVLKSALEQITESYDVHMKQGSGWKLTRIKFSQLNVYIYKTAGGGGRCDGLVPAHLARCKSLLTLPPTKDNKCFLYCILSYLHPAKRPVDRYKFHSYRPYLDSLNTEGLSYPVKLKDIATFETNNRLAINVVASKSPGQITFLYKSPFSYENVINLLLHENHYSLVKSWSAFLNYRKDQARIPCQKCGSFFIANRSSSKRYCNYCVKLGSPGDNLVFMRPGSFKIFDQQAKSRPHPFVYYCDLETIAKNYDEMQSSKTRKVRKHEAISIAYLRVCGSPEFSQKKPTVITGPGCIRKFFEAMQREIDYMDHILQNISYPLDMTEKKELIFKETKNCDVCGLRLNGSSKVRDHDHLKKKDNFRGTLCTGCNLNIMNLERTRTPVLFHNSGKFDSQFLIQEINMTKQPVESAIGKTGENILSLDIFNKRMTIIDSINHLPSSLATLTEVMKKAKKPLVHTNNCFSDEYQREHVTRKGIFPYEFLDNVSKLNMTSLPPKEEFYDNLRECEVSEEDYQHAQNVWRIFNCKTLRDYLEIYLSLDVTLLADVFENYRTFFFTKFGLDASRYVSLPSLSYDSMMKFTKCKMEYIHNPQMYSLIKRSIRGGVAMIPHRHARANNPLIENYDNTQPTTHIVNLDCNSLYASIMCKRLPYKCLKFETEKSLDQWKEIIANYSENDKIGYLIECDLEYPSAIHDITAEFPLAPEHIRVTPDMISPYGQQIITKLNLRLDKNPKLLNTQYDKRNYVCHVDNLQFYLRKGMILRRVGQVLSFRQKAIFKPYIELCLSERNRPENTVYERMLFKLLANSIYGKCLANLERRVTLKLVSDPTTVFKEISSPRFRHADVINSSVTQVTSNKTRHLVNIPYYIGSSILDLSKLTMMRFYYDVFIKKYGIHRVQLEMSDTDSFLMKIQCEDIYQDLKDLKVVDFGNYPVDHPFYDTTNAGKMFYLKDESGAKPISSFTGLRAKSYTIQYADGGGNKVVSKGVPRQKLKHLSYGTFESVLHKVQHHLIRSQALRSFKHQIFTIKKSQLALSPFDSKRYLCSTGYHTLPYGHYKISREKNPMPVLKLWERHDQIAQEGAKQT